MIYFDNSATTAVLPRAAETAQKYMREQFFNPAAAYSPAVKLERDISSARGVIARELSCEPSEVFFTSCGTESNNTALFGALHALPSNLRGRGRVLISAVEHPSVYEPAMELREQCYDVQLVPVDNTGRVSAEALKSLLTPDTRLVSIMHVNNESGAINDIDALYSIIKNNAPDALLHVDGVQAFMKEPAVKCDMYSVSGHKLHAPKGVGALYVGKGVRVRPYLLGGGQESGFRSGTENVPGIAGFGAAAEMIKPGPFPVRDCLKDLILKEIPDVQINSPEGSCSSVLNVSFIGCRAEVLLHQLEQDGIYVSTGSACSSKDKGSHVLSAMGLSPEAIEGAIRFSFCRENTEEEMRAAVDKLKAYVTSQRNLRSAFRKR